MIYENPIIVKKLVRSHKGEILLQKTLLKVFLKYENSNL